MVNRYRQLRYGRIAIQTVATAVITAAVAFGVPCVLSRMQLVPAILAGSLLWLAVWAVVTMVFGRVYCSTICPAGALMDVVSALARRHRGRYVYSLPSNRVRVAVTVCVAVCLLAGVTIALVLTDPYSAYTRIVSAVVRPMAIGFGGLAAAIITLLAIAVFAARRGRLLCNTVCPAGTLLGFVSRYSLYHPDINTDLCTNCGRCADSCKSECIDLADHIVDLSRCVLCFDCMVACRDGAITYRRGRHRLMMPMMQRVVGNAGVSAVESPCGGARTDSMNRRAFIAGAVAAVGTLAAGAADHNAGRRVAGAVELRPLNPVVPPGATSRKDYLSRCTACGACVAACPTGVLTMSLKDFGVRHALVPVLHFDKAYCRPDCTECTHLCPTKALTPLTQNEKMTSAIGRARVVATNCMLYVNGEPCSVCVRRCPHGAVSITETADGRRLPYVDASLCTGCGICTACPSEPYGAIVIEGI